LHIIGGVQKDAGSGRTKYNILVKELYLCGGGKFAYKTKKNHVVVYYLLLLKESSKHITFI
jgi:hypothetical protein